MHGRYETFLGGCHCSACLDAVRRKHVRRVRDDAATEVSTGGLVRKKWCKAYDLVTKICRCGNEHGSVSTYGNHACRCDACKKVMSAYNKANRNWKECPAYDADAKRCCCGREHGRATTYTSHACRCDACKEAKTEQWREHYTANKERIAEQKREHYAANKGRHAERVREWRKVNPDKMIARDQRRRARKMNAPGNLHNTATYSFWWNGLLDLYERCPVCEREFIDGCSRMGPSLEHVVSLKNGGHHSTENTTIMCKSCNSSKGWKRDLYEWLPERRKALGLPPLT